MSRNKITDYSQTAADNEDIAGIGIRGSDPVRNMDNALREIMSHLADMNAGDAPLHDTLRIADVQDGTKGLRFSASQISAGETRVVTIPDKDFTIADAEDIPTIPNIALIDSSDDGSKNTALNIPMGTTAQRPKTPDGPQIRRNSETDEWEVWDTAAWRSIGAGAVSYGASQLLSPSEKQQAQSNLGLTVHP